MRVALVLVSAVACLHLRAAAAEELDAATVIARYVEARGGAERWRALSALELTGTYSTFSFREPFRLVHRRGDLYRLDYVVLDKPAVRARDAQGPWWRDPLLQPEAARLFEDPYKSQLERESMFGLVLLDHERRDIAVELLGEGEVEGLPTVDLRLTFPDERQEIWHLDVRTGLEVAVDAQVWDHTQGQAPMRRRTFFDDFRSVSGLVLPFQVEHEFGARLEVMSVEGVRVDPDLDDREFESPTESPPDPSGPGDPEDGGAS